MFLERLDKDERESLIELAYYAANYNKKFTIEQQHIIDNFKKELNLPYYKIKGLKLSEIVANFKLKNKNLLFLEVYTLILADKQYDTDEQDFIMKLQKELNISEQKKEKIEQWIIDFIEIHNRALHIVDIND